MNGPIDIDELVAELYVLERFDSIRHAEGHDYGGGQRHAELGRRRRQLREAGVDASLDAYLANASAVALEQAFERVGRPRMARLERESYRQGTRASRRSLEAWRRLRGELIAAVGVEATTRPAAVGVRMLDDDGFRTWLVDGKTPRAS